MVRLCLKNSNHQLQLFHTSLHRQHEYIIASTPHHGVALVHLAVCWVLQSRLIWQHAQGFCDAFQAGLLVQLRKVTVSIVKTVYSAAVSTAMKAQAIKVFWQGRS